MSKMNRIYKYVEISIAQLEGTIKRKFYLNFGEEEAPNKISLFWSYYTPFVRAKIFTDTKKLERAEERIQIDRRENNWEILCDLIKENFREDDAKVVKQLYSYLAEKEVQKQILFEGHNPFKKLKTMKELKNEMENQ